MIHLFLFFFFTLIIASQLAIATLQKKSVSSVSRESGTNRQEQYEQIHYKEQRNKEFK